MLAVLVYVGRGRDGYSKLCDDVTTYIFEAISKCRLNKSRLSKHGLVSLIDEFGAEFWVDAFFKSDQWTFDQLHFDRLVIVLHYLYRTNHTMLLAYIQSINVDLKTSDIFCLTEY